MSPDEVASNLTEHQYFLPDEAAQLKKMEELIAYIRAEIARAPGNFTKGKNQGLNIATGLINKLPALVAKSYREISGDKVYGFITNVRGKMNGGSPDYDVHAILLPKLGIQWPQTRAEYFDEKLELVSKYVEQCEANGETVNPRKMPKLIQIGDEGRSSALWLFFNRVFAGKYDHEPE